MDYEDYKTIKKLKTLASIKGHGTELVSFYIKAGSNLAEATGTLSNEQSQSQNIRSDTLRRSVQGAIQRMLQYLRGLRKVPANGLALFAGEGELFDISLKMPIRISKYLCENKFYVEPLIAMLSQDRTYALLVMDGKDATIGYLQGTSIKIIKEVESFAHKVQGGGMSEQRFKRTAEESLEYYYKKIADYINELYKGFDFNIEGLIIGGASNNKQAFIRMNLLDKRIKVLGLVSTGYTGEYGLQELIKNASDLLKGHETQVEEELLERFKKDVVEKKAIFGKENVLSALTLGKVVSLILNKDVDEIDDLMVFNREVIFVSSEGKGKEFLQGFKGIGAFLR